MTTSNLLTPAHLRRALLAALALLALGVGVTPGHAVAASGAGTITTVLYPGWNMVGWVGPSTPTSELFDAIPALRQVSAWDAEVQAYQHAVRRRYDDLATLAPGVGLWLHLRGNSAVEWTRDASNEGVVLILREGGNLVGWTGNNGTPIGNGIAQVAEAVAGARGWDAQMQRFQQYSPKTPRAGDLTELNQGDAVWLDVTSPIGWWQHGAAKPPFTFYGDFPGDIQADLWAEHERIQSFFAVRFGAVASGPPSRVWRYVSALLSEIPGGTYRDRGPWWLVEGAHQYAVSAYYEATGQPNFSQDRDRAEQNIWARRSALALAEFEGTDRRIISNVDRGLGFFAVERLTDQAGDLALFEFYRLIPRTSHWREAFNTAFGIEVDDFYEDFADYRAEAFPPFPHLTDEKSEPVLVVLDDISAEQAATIRNEFADVVAFFPDRFEAEAEFTVYVASNTSTASHAVPGWFDARACQRWPLWGVVVIVLQYCGDTIPLDYAYIGGLIRELAHRVPNMPSGRPYDRAPRWFDDGAIAYAETMYGEAAGTVAAGEFREAALLAASSNSVALQDLATWLDVQGAGSWPTRAHGFLAVEWLADHAGDPAVFDYYRRLPEATSPDEAFEQAFGLTFEEFYEQFEAYRATLRFHDHIEPN